MKHLEGVSCDLCGFDRAKEIYPARLGTNLQDLNFSVVGELGQRHRIVRCLSCDLVFSNPRDKRKDLIQKYAELSIEKYRKAKKSRTLTSAKDLRLVQKYIKSGNLLDVGYFTGIFLSQFPKKCKSTGVELSKAACEKAQADLPTASDLDGAKYETLLGNRFLNTITIWDVSEHLPSPTNTLISLKQNLAPGGHIFIFTPNLGGLMSKLMQRKWPHLIRGHIYYCDKKTIKRTSEKCGFEVVSISSYFHNFRISYILKRLKLIKNADHLRKFLKYVDVELRINLNDVLMIGAKKKIIK